MSDYLTRLKAARGLETKARVMFRGRRMTTQQRRDAVFPLPNHGNDAIPARNPFQEYGFSLEQTDSQNAMALWGKISREKGIAKRTPGMKRMLLARAKAMREEVTRGRVRPGAEVFPAGLDEDLWSANNKLKYPRR